MIRPDIVLLWDSSANDYVDLSSHIADNTSFNFLSDVDDEIYIGCSRRFIGFIVDLSQAGNYAGLSYKYATGDEEFKNLQLLDSYSFSESKYCRWNLPSDCAHIQFTTSFPNTVSTSPSDTEYYWIKLTASTVTSTAIIEKIRLIPFATYTTPLKVGEFLQVKENYSYSTIPTDLRVEDIIRRQEDYINYRTKKSWRFQAVTEDTDPSYVDFNRGGIYLRHRNFWRVYSVRLWNGSSWETLEEGRNKDYHINYDLGMIIISRMFSIPAVYGMLGRYNMWGEGAFKNSIQVDYVWGRNLEVDPEFYMVEDIATKLVAKDLLQHSDYTQLIVSGSDKVPLDVKIRELSEDIEIKIDSLTGIQFY